MIIKNRLYNLLTDMIRKIEIICNFYFLFVLYFGMFGLDKHTWVKQFKEFGDNER